MLQPDYLQLLNNETNFRLRHAIERLREGLFDPLAVRLLTAHEKRLNRAIDECISRLEEGKSPHLCICGSYGQGKSHSLSYIRDRALREGFVVSNINLDPREIPFHNFKDVYRELIDNLDFPDSDFSLSRKWKLWAEEQIHEGKKDIHQVVSSLLPEEMPHLFRSVMTALAQKNMVLTSRQKETKKHANFRPNEFPWILKSALEGVNLPTVRLRQALKYRQVSFYRDASLTCRGADPYLRMIRSLGRIFQKMGYRGWALLFDEGEAISQVRLLSRSQSYRILHEFFKPQDNNAGLLPVFAFTDDFFIKVEEEDYDRLRKSRGEEVPCFDRNYTRSWKRLNLYRLEDLSAKEWQEISEKLLRLYARAYEWQPPEEETHRMLKERLIKSEGEETRYKLKGLVDQLDLMHQDDFL